MAYLCEPCGRSFGGLTGFDKHQSWTIKGNVLDGNMTLTCQDPATLTRRDGSKMFKLDARNRWVLVVGKDHPHA